MVRIRLHVDGAADLAGDLRELAERVARPRGIEAAADAMARAMRQGVRDEILGPWPALSPATIRQRRALGFAAGPPLIRTGSLLDEIRVLEVTAAGATVGIAGSARAAALDARRRFVGVAERDADEIAEEIARASLEL